jgi:hypothetical protein
MSKGVQPLESTQLMSWPLSTRNLTTSRRPSVHAQWIGSIPTPSSDAAKYGAPWPMSDSTISTSPRFAAQCTSVWPPASRAASMSFLSSDDAKIASTLVPRPICGAGASGWVGLLSGLVGAGDRPMRFEMGIPFE